MRFKGRTSLRVIDSRPAEFFAQVAGGWDAKTIVDRLEPRVGKDPRYVRMNGTLVGSVVGGLLHAVPRAGFGHASFCRGGPLKMLRRRPKSIASTARPLRIVMALLDRATRRGTVPLRVARSGRAMTKRQQSCYSIDFGRRLSSTFRILRFGRSGHDPEDIFVSDKL